MVGGDGGALVVVVLDVVDVVDVVDVATVLVGAWLELVVAPDVVVDGRLVVEDVGMVVVGTIEVVVEVVVGRVAGGRVVTEGPGWPLSSASDAAASGRSTPSERLRRPTGSAQAVARLRRQPSGWVSAQVWTESGASRLPPRSTRRLTARIRTACRRGASIRWRAYPRGPNRPDHSSWSYDR